MQLMARSTGLRPVRRELWRTLRPVAARGKTGLLYFCVGDEEGGAARRVRKEGRLRSTGWTWVDHGMWEGGHGQVMRARASLYSDLSVCLCLRAFAEPLLGPPPHQPAPHIYLLYLRTGVYAAESASKIHTALRQNFQPRGEPRHLNFHLRCVAARQRKRGSCG